MEHEASKLDQNYTVVARRYRPRSFAELIGQDHIAQALGKALATGRVGHAYLFTGARGVGKTSTARIFAKALNASEEANQEVSTDIAQAIDAGDDMDVIEIDGASNRGIEEIRQLRANVNVRPSRARYKIYIIDEVHMLTNQAFNALLKTLEEPPSHVKFIFCTTDPDKIPITVLSRCQRFDFVPVKFEAIQLRLQEISAAEGYAVDKEALALLARRAAGSMRDSQSLLEQVMSFSVDKITVEQVHALLGTADEGRLAAIVETLAHANSLQALALIDEATQGGADPGQLAEQLLNYLRDVMAVGVGGGPNLLKLANPAGYEELKQLAEDWGVQTVLSAIQILDEALVRMRTSVSATTLLEVALVQICQLEQLASIPALLEAVMQVSGGNATRPRPTSPISEKKNAELNAAAPSVERAALAKPPAAAELAPTVPAPHEPAQEPPANPSRAAAMHISETHTSHASTAPPAVARSLAPSAAAVSAATDQSDVKSTATNRALASVVSLPHSDAVSARSSTPAPPASQGVRSGALPEALAEWRRSLASIDGMLADFAGMAVAVEPQGSDRWNIVFPPGAAKPCEYCEQAQRKAELGSTLQRTLGRAIQISFAVMPGEIAKPSMATPQAAVRAQKMREMAEHPFIKKLCEALDGEIIRVDSPREPLSTRSGLNSPQETMP